MRTTETGTGMRPAAALTRRLASALCLASLIGSAPSFAGNCESNFSKQGNAFTGSSYRSSVALADLSVASAINQMQATALEKKMNVLAADAEGGSLLIEEPETFQHKPIPMIVSAAQENSVTTVSLEVKLGRGALTKADSMREEICKMLATLKPGAAGERAARDAAARTATAAPEKLDALAFSLKLANQANENQSTINPRYKGKKYTLTGRAAFIMEDGDDYNVGFDIPEPGDMLLKPGPMGAQFKVSISCIMARNQTAYALTLRERDKIVLTGTFARYDQFKHVVWLEGCVKAL